MKKHPKSSIPQEPYFTEEGGFRFRQISSDRRKGVEIKPLPPLLVSFFLRFESSCSLDCCGLSALGFKPPIEWDKRWNYRFEVFRALQEEEENAVSLEAEVVYVSDLRTTLYKDDWVFLLRYLMDNMKKTKQWK